MSIPSQSHDRHLWPAVVRASRQCAACRAMSRVQAAERQLVCCSDSELGGASRPAAGK
jgi:hypothetical protein